MRLSWKKGFYPGLLALALISLPLSAEIYKWTDRQGNVHYSDEKSARPNARPIKLKSSINSYAPISIPKFERARPDKGENTLNTVKQLPKLRPRQVIIYTTDWCGYCKKAKKYFMQKGIRFAERDIEKSPQAQKEYQSLGGGGVPLILVGNKTGTQKLSGFSSARFDAAYQ